MFDCHLLIVKTFFFNEEELDGNVIELKTNQLFND